MIKLKLIKLESREHMRWTISLADNPKYLYVVLKGRFQLSEFNEVLDDVFALKKEFRGHPILFSDLELDVADVTTKELADIRARFIEMNASIADTKFAIVMKTDKDFELADRWRSMTQDASTARFGVFRNERKAAKWLARVRVK